MWACGSALVFCFRQLFNVNLFESNLITQRETDFRLLERKCFREQKMLEGMQEKLLG